MEDPSEKEIEEKLYNYLEKNQEKAFTVGALKKRLEEIVDETNLSIVYLLKILNRMRDNEKIHSIQHNGETHFFSPEIFDLTQYKLNKTHFIVPEIYISTKQDTGKVKKKYCTRCKKEVLAKKQKGNYSFFSDFFNPLYRYSEKGLTATITGWYCPDCLEGPLGTKKGLVIARISCIIFISMTMFCFIISFFIGGSLQSWLFVIGLIFLVLYILIGISILIHKIGVREAKKRLEKMKGKPKEVFDMYIKEKK